MSKPAIPHWGPVGVGVGVADVVVVVVTTQVGVVPSGPGHDFS